MQLYALEPLFKIFYTFACKRFSGKNFFDYFNFFAVILIKGHKVDFLCLKKRV